MAAKAGLTAKQERFVSEYLTDLNATQAAIRAGYSEKTAYSIGEENLRKPEIAAAVKNGMDLRAARTEITADRVLQELAKIAFADIRKAVRWGRSPIDDKSENAARNGLGIFPVELVPSELVDDDTAIAISEVSLTQTGIKIKMHDKKSALVDIGRHLGMFIEKHELTGKDGDAINVVTRIERVIIDVKEQSGND